MATKATELSSKNYYHGRIFDVVQRKLVTPDGMTVTRDVVEHGDAVAFIALLPDENRAPLIQLGYEYRAGVDDMRWSLPAGLVNAGEDRPTAAIREAQEEGGLQFGTAKELFAMSSSEGFTSEEVSIVLLTDYQGEVEKHFDQDEFVTTKLVPLKEAIQMQHEGIIKSAPGVAALIWAELHYAELAELVK
ncbi:NUDIX hydrolase [Periweissella cryptocerci]|uniref:NUDIX hydrolase n=1 Tax=Periweissella cryptocerci TaxID=2506420 RepID=A0A4P6YSN0_9LACO|nr:NUDIX hydrolase [Periweissella cryptocerci]QBO35637.1 NUDIX hydrolase [Periweissella cryptocerci]